MILEDLLADPVSRLWNAGRQCMNFTCGLPVSRIVSALTWYGSSSLIRSSQTSLDSPIETQTSVSRKSQPSTASATSSVIAILAPLAAARSLAVPDDLLGRPERPRAAILTSIPSLAPPIR